MPSEELGKFEVSLSVALDPKSLARAVQDVQKAFKAAAAGKIELPPIVLRTDYLEQALKRLTNRVQTQLSRITRSLSAATPFPALPYIPGRPPRTTLPVPTSPFPAPPYVPWQILHPSLSAAALRFPTLQYIPGRMPRAALLAATLPFPALPYIPERAARAALPPAFRFPALPYIPRKIDLPHIIIRADYLEQALRQLIERDLAQIQPSRIIGPLSAATISPPALPYIPETKQIARAALPPPTFRLPALPYIPEPEQTAKAAAQVSEAISSATAAALSKAAGTVAAAANQAAATIGAAGATVAEAEVSAGNAAQEASRVVSGAATSAAEVSASVAAAAAGTAEEIRDALNAALSALGIDVAKWASELDTLTGAIQGGKLAVNEAIAGVSLALTEQSQLISAVSSAAGEPISSMAEAVAKFKGFAPEQIAKVAEQLGTSVNTVTVAFDIASKELEANAGQALKASKKLTEVRRLLLGTLQSMGIKAPKTAVDLAARYIAAGEYTFEQAVEDLTTGTTQASAVIKDLAGTTAEAAKMLAQAYATVYKSRVAGTPPGQPPPGQPPPGQPPPPPPPGGQPPLTPGQTVQLASAMASASQSAGGLMRALLNLRWQIFTIGFFLFTLVGLFRRLANAAKESAATVDRVSSAVTVLRARGVEDVKGLINRLIEASGYFLTTEEAARKLSRLAIIGVPPEVIELVPRLMEVARAVAVLSDEYGTAEQVFDKFVDAVARGQMRMATTTGAVSGTMEDALDRFHAFVQAQSNVAGGADRTAVALDRLPEALRQVTEMLIQEKVATAESVEQLTAYQKTLLTLWAILDNGEQVLAALQDGFDSGTVAIQTFDYSVKELARTLGATISEGLRLPAFVEKLGDKIRESFGATIRIIDQIFRPDVYARRMEEATKAAEQMWERMTDAERQALMEQARMELARMKLLPFATEADVIRTARELLISLAYASEAVFETQSKGAKEASADLLENLNSLRDLLATTEQTSDATGDLANQMANLQSSLGQFASVYSDYLNEIEDAQIAHNRWYEDLMRDYRRRLSELEGDRERERERAERDKRRRDAAEDLARRLLEIERDLADRLRGIWRDYYDEMFMAELDRDALRAFLAARRRDREITEAHERAERERQEAYERYNQQIRDIEDAYRRRMAEVEQRMKEERERIEKWLQQEMEDRRIYEQRAEEDRRRAFERRLADMTRSLLLEYELQRIANDKSLSEEQRFLAAMSATFALYNARFESESRALYDRLTAGATSYFNWLRDVFMRYYQMMLGYRNSILPLLTPPTWPSSQPGTYRGGTRIYPMASGGAAIVSSPTTFLAGEAGPELVVAVPLRSTAILTHQFNATINTAAGDITGRINAAIIQTLENVVREVM